jgi:hypothetical protein
MSYTPPTGLPFFSAYNSQFQNESNTTFDLDFDTFVNIDNVSADTLVIPSNAFIWGDCRSVADASDGDLRHMFRFHFTSTALTDQTTTQETSGNGGNRNYPMTSDMMYALNKTGTTQNTKLRCTAGYNDHDQVANFNRLVGVFIR